MKPDFMSQYFRGDLNLNDLVTYVAVRTLANERSGSVTITTPTLANTLGNQFSRHAIARSLRKLQTKNLVSWQTKRGGVSTIAVR